MFQSVKRKRNRAVRERALVLAAGKLFARRGYEATKTREIASLAGCAEGLIHRYFNGKAGLLVELVRRRTAQEDRDLSELSPGATLEDEVRQLVQWELRTMWEDREFLQVIVPRAILDRHLGRVLARIGSHHRVRLISARLKRFKECHSRPQEREALAQSICVLGFMFGFVRPVILRQNRDEAELTAAAIAGILARSFS